MTSAPRVPEDTQDTELLSIRTPERLLRPTPGIVRAGGRLALRQGPCALAGRFLLSPLLRLRLLSALPLALTVKPTAVLRAELVLSSVGICHRRQVEIGFSRYALKNQIFLFGEKSAVLQGNLTPGPAVPEAFNVATLCSGGV